MAVTIPTAHIAQRLKNLIKDPAYDYDGEYVQTLMRDGLMFVAGRIYLPDLLTDAEVETVFGQDCLDMPEDFHRTLSREAWNVTYSRPVVVHESLQWLKERCGHAHYGDEGTVDAVALQGTRLYYIRRPAEPETLRVTYYRKPMLDDCGLPEHFVNPVVLNYTAAAIWGEIEGEPNQPGSQSEKYDAKFNGVLDELQLHLGPSEHSDLPTPVNPVRNWAHDLGL